MDVEIDNTVETGVNNICECRTTCSRKSGKKQGCSCRDKNLKCSELCQCGTKKKGCSNKDAASVNQSDHVNTPGVNSRFEQSEIEVAAEREEIQRIIQSLDSETLRNIILEISAVGSGSADFIRNMLTEQSSNLGPSNPEVPAWCVCGVCRKLGKPEEDVCCGKKICITSYQKFSKVCLDKDVLETSIKPRADIRAEEITFSINDYRRQAYYQYIIWRHGKLGRGNRRPCAACVVPMIRITYPDADGNYMGFMSS